MRKYFLYAFVLITTVLFPSAILAAEKVSVYVEGNVSKLQEQIVNNAFMSRLSSTKDFVAYERNETFINAITREHDYQVSGDVPESQIRKIANKYGVDYVIAVSVMSDDETFFMTARLINIETGKIEKSVSQDRSPADNKTLKNMSNNLAYRLLNKYSK